MGLPLTVTAVICTQGTAPTLGAALRSMTGELNDGDDVLVVVDGGPLMAAAQAAVPGAGRVVTQPATGVGAARQRALDEAITDLVLFLDDDEIPRPGWRRALAAPFDDERIAAVGGTILARWPNGKPPPWLHDRLRTAYGERVAGPQCDYSPFGGNLAVRREAAQAVGGFSAELGHAPGRPGLHEDAELCDRLVAAGWALAEAPDAVVEHLVRSEQVGLVWVLRRVATRSRGRATGENERRARRLPPCGQAPRAGRRGPGRRAAPEARHLRCGPTAREPRLPVGEGDAGPRNCAARPRPRPLTSVVAMAVDDRPTTSVIIPAYRASTLPQCLDRVLAQDYSDSFEVIVCMSADDASQLLTLPADDRLRVLTHVPRLSAAAARNRAVAASRGGFSPSPMPTPWRTSPGYGSS